MLDEIHPVATWEIDVLDSLDGAVITFHALRTDDPDEDSIETYPLASMGFEMDVLRRWREELDGLIRFMESGGKSASRDN
jgi:hypothetical protein